MTEGDSDSAEAAAPSGQPPPPSSPPPVAPSSEQSEEFLLKQNLEHGFRAIKKRREEGPSDATIVLEGKQSFLSRVVVNFIDPTSSTGSVISPSNNNPTQGTQGMIPGQKPPLELYNKLASVFQKEYNSTLRQVPYQHFRSGAHGVIDTLRVQTVMTRSHGGLVTSIGDDDDGMVPWAGTGAASSGSDGGDPSEWHNTPYCHVYIAACESLEHYRNKVKPSIQAFLSQIDATAKANGGKETTVSSTTPGTASGAQYVIAFVPTGDKIAEEAPRSRMGATFASRVRAARQTMAREAPTNTSAGSGISDSGELETEGPDSSGSLQNVTAHLSKVDREIARRFAVDFSNGNVCTLSSLVSDEKEGANESAQSELQKSEWNSFMKCVGTAIGYGFRDRCQRYDEELRQQQALRGKEERLVAEGSVKSKLELKRAAKRFDLSYFFLVKESLAFTYEQMCLPSEALIQYDELRAILPDVKPDTVLQTKDSELSAFSRAAISGNSVVFRKRLRAVEKLEPIAEVIQQYLFSRETALLFQMNKSVEVVQRCTAFVNSMYKFKLNTAHDENEKDERVRIERWAFEFAWEVKRACDTYLAEDVTASAVETDEQDEANEKQRTRRMDEALARHICDLLEFARIRMLKLGDLVLASNPVRAHVDSRVTKELSTPWKPWKPMTSNQDESLHVDDDFDILGSDSFIDEALVSEETFLARYLEFLKIFEAFNRFSGRKRCAARIAVDMAGLHVQEGDLEKAATVLGVAAKVYEEDYWQACHFLLLFRICGYQRQVSTADEYVETLVNCFGPVHSHRAPPKALNTLQDDLESILKSSWISRSKLASKPVFDPILGLDGIKPTQRSGSSRSLLKKVYSVGEKACVTISLTSYLPREIEVENMSVDLVPYRVYVAAMEDSMEIREEDKVRSLQLKGLTKLVSGANELSFDWVPMASGQFIIAAANLKWKGVLFTYSASQLKRPTIRIDVVPSEPTQTLELTPGYLLPGHEQPLKLSFKPGTDIVEKGSMRFVCSPGVMLVPPDQASSEKKFTSSCEMDLPPCTPGGTVEINLIVKSSEVERSKSDQGSHLIHTTVSTSYRRPFPEDTEADEESEAEAKRFLMDHSMEAKVPTLEKQALTIEAIETIAYALDRTMLNISLQCNTPEPVKVTKWSIKLPSFLSLAESGDMNECLVNSTITPGERISMAFDCMFTTSDTSQTSEQQLLVEIEDSFGHLFNEPLNLGLKRPTASRAALPELNTVPLEVIPSILEGLVDSPIQLTYKIDSTNIASLPGSVRYALIFNPIDWIVSGKTEGLVPTAESEVSLNFVAIPVRPGTIESYPVLSLHFHSSDRDSSIALDTNEQSEPTPFRSFASPIHSTVAVPLATKQVKSGA